MSLNIWESYWHISSTATNLGCGMNFLVTSVGATDSYTQYFCATPGIAGNTYYIVSPNNAEGECALSSWISVDSADAKQSNDGWQYSWRRYICNCHSSCRCNQYCSQYCSQYPQEWDIHLQSSVWYHRWWVYIPWLVGPCTLLVASAQNPSSEYPSSPNNTRYKEHPDRGSSWRLIYGTAWIVVRGALMYISFVTWTLEGSIVGAGND